MMNKPKPDQRKQKHHAQGLIEFALILPLLLLLILGAMDIGRLFFTKIVITNAAREGANYLAYFPSDEAGSFSAIEDEAASSNVTVVAGEVGFLYDPPSAEEYDSVGVSITKTVDLVFDDILQFLGLLNGQVDLNSTVWMRVQ